MQCYYHEINVDVYLSFGILNYPTILVILGHRYSSLKRVQVKRHRCLLVEMYINNQHARGSKLFHEYVVSSEENCCIWL